MTAEALPIELRPAGFPWGYVAGKVISVGFFIPPLEDVVRWEERHRTKVLTPAGQKPRAIMYTPEKTKAWHEHVGEHALLELRSVEIDGPEDFTLPLKDSRFLVKLRFNAVRPASYPKRVVHNTTKPDVDNYVKGLLDGLVQGRIIEDDAPVTDLLVMKRYADGEHPPGVEVEITAIPL
jgi:Holliday junction resolvase RusA-like endonuclease